MNSTNYSATAFVLSLAMFVCVASRAAAAAPPGDPGAEVQAAGGAVSGLVAQKVVCHNISTGDSVTIRDGARSWDCAEAGLVVHSGDRIRLTISGTGAESPTFGPSCTPEPSGNGTCILYSGRICFNITGSFDTSEEACLANLCDIYGPSNAGIGFSSWCVYQGKTIKAYSTPGIYRAGDFCGSATSVTFEQLKVYRSDGVSSYCEYTGRSCVGGGAVPYWELPLGMIFTGPCQ